MARRGCKPLVARATATITAGTSVVIDFPTTIQTPDFGKCVPFIIETDLVALVGTEEVAISIEGVSIPVVGNHGLFITSQMLRRQRTNGCVCKSPVYIVQYGATAQGAVFFARRGFAKRKTTIETTTVAIPPATAPAPAV